MAEKLLDEHKNALSEVTLEPSQGGVFEVSMNGAEIYSKQKTGQFPNERALLIDLAGKLSG